MRGISRLEESALRVSDVKFTAGTPMQADDGLLGFVSCVYGALHLDGLSLRRTLDGRMALSFPARVDSAGRQHPYIRPLDDSARREIESEVFKHLGLERSP